jgi:hypothetical protein
MRDGEGKVRTAGNMFYNSILQFIGQTPRRILVVWRSVIKDGNRIRYLISDGICSTRRRGWDDITRGDLNGQESIPNGDDGFGDVPCIPVPVTAREPAMLLYMCICI